MAAIRAASFCAASAGRSLSSSEWSTFVKAGQPGIPSTPAPFAADSWIVEQSAIVRPRFHRRLLDGVS